MEALITGGAGFIGSNLATTLIDRGYSVKIFDNFSTGHAENLPDSAHITVQRGDILEYSQVLEAVRGVDVVFHMAAQVGNVLSLERPDTDLMTNALGTIHVLNACRESGVKQLVYSSSSAIFGETKVVPVDENHVQSPMSPYGLSKLTAEKYCLILGEEYGINACCLRYFNVYGANQRFNPYGNVIPIFVERALKGMPLTIYGDGNQTRDFIEVRDVVMANVLACENSAAGVFNIGTGTATSVRELAAQVISAVGKEVDLVYAPPRAGEVLNSVADTSKAVKTLNFAPSVTIEEGVQAYAAWFVRMNARESNPPN